MHWLERIKQRWRARQYVYGCCFRPDDGHRIDRARLNERTGRVEFVLWKAGEQGHVEDYWHVAGEGWERFFIASQTPGSEVCMSEPQSQCSVPFVGSLVMFEGRIYRVIAHGDRAGTFDIVRHPDDMAGDRWRNVPRHLLRPVTHNVEFSGGRLFARPLE